MSLFTDSEATHSCSVTCGYSHGIVDPDVKSGLPPPHVPGDLIVDLMRIKKRREDPFLPDLDGAIFENIGNGLTKHALRFQKETVQPL